MIDLDPRDLGEVKTILERHIPDRKVWVFGSRARGTAKSFSDLDLAVEGPEKLPFDVFCRLLDDFEESNLPIRVDIIELCAVDPTFKMHLEKDRMTLL